MLLMLNVLIVQHDVTALDLTDRDPNVGNDDAAPVLPLTFEVVDTGTSKGKTLLIDSHGYNYCIKMCRDSRVYWRPCNARQLLSICKLALNSTA